MMPAQKMRMEVRVVEGRVVVSQTVPKVAKGQALSNKPPKKGERKQVAGPQEISQPEWEKRFVELQAQQEVEIKELGEKLEARPLDTSAMNDAFGRFVDRNQ
jgi:hypothetical protein